MPWSVPLRTPDSVHLALGLTLDLNFTLDMAGREFGIRLDKNLAAEIRQLIDAVYSGDGERLQERSKESTFMQAVLSITGVGENLFSRCTWAMIRPESEVVFENIVLSIQAFYRCLRDLEFVQP